MPLFRKLRSKQKGFANIFIVIALLFGMAVLGFNQWANFKYGHIELSQNQTSKEEKFEKKTNKNDNSKENSSQEKVTEFYDNSNIKGLPSCQGNSLLTSSPMDLDKIPAITPIGGISPPGHVFPSDHGGIMYPGAWEKFYQAETEIKAPATGHIFRIQKTSYRTNGQLTKENYDFGFSPCREFVIYMSHISTISPNLQKLIEPLQNNCNTQSEHEQEYTFCNFPAIDYQTKSGEAIGSVKSNGKDVMGMDFGAFDTRTPQLKFLGNYYAEARNLQTLHTVCPYDYYSFPLKEQLYGKIMRKTEPRCGVFMQDIDNSIAGNWQVKDYKQGGNQDSWDKYFAVVHDDTNPEIGVIAFGGIVTNPGKIGFTPTHEGTINREPNEVTADGKLYCYTMGAADSRSNQKSSIRSGKMLIQLVDRLTLKVEFQQGICDSNINFASPTIYQR